MLQEGEWMELIAEYLEKIELLDEDPFYKEVADKKALRKTVRDNNKRADRIRAIAKEIEEKHPDLKSAFARLLHHEKQPGVGGPSYFRGHEL